MEAALDNVTVLVVESAFISALPLQSESHQWLDSLACILLAQAFEWFFVSFNKTLCHGHTPTLGPVLCPVFECH